jgi:hypothetical protein
LERRQMPGPNSRAHDVLVDIMLIRLWHVVESRFRKRLVVRAPDLVARAGIVLDAVALRQIVQVVAATRTDEISCEACFQQMDLYVEITLQGSDPALLMPLVQHHLSFCRDCREEFDTLLVACSGTY